jgi:glutamine amidotransferase
MADHSKVAIIDYEMGNLFSVQRACDWAGLAGVITSDPVEVRNADAVILPGVGAFPTAMEALDRNGLSDAIRAFVGGGRPLVGICLGIQLLMSESSEFGSHAGLGIVPGRVVSFEPVLGSAEPAKVPQMQWNRIQEPKSQAWGGTLLEGLSDREFMYFVHSYYVLPSDPSTVLATSRYADIEFCSAIQKDNIFACQFHPERSGRAGLHIYRNLARKLGSPRRQPAN